MSVAAELGSVMAGEMAEQPRVLAQLLSQRAIEAKLTAYTCCGVAASSASVASLRRTATRLSR